MPQYPPAPARLAEFTSFVFLQLLVVSTGPLTAATLVDLSFESVNVGSLLNDVAGWTQLAEPVGGGRLQIADEPDGNQFLTTELGNNQAGRYAWGFENPGFTPQTTLTLTMDVWDPAVNARSGLNTFPRAVAGVFELTGNSGMPPYVGLEHVDLGQIDVAEWVLAGENFANRQLGPVDSVQQDTWYTVQSRWDFANGSKDLSVKTRGGSDPFQPVLLPTPIGFADSNQHVGQLNAMGIRMLRGTRIDNLRLEYNDPDLGPPPRLVDVAQPRSPVAGAPKPSDVVFSVRSFFSSPSNYPAVAAAFHATRNDWTYAAANSSAVNTLAAQGMTSGGAMNPAIHGLPSTNAGIARHWDGGTPLSRYNDTRYSGDVNATEYRQAALNSLKSYINAGNVRVQWDDPRMNTELVVMFGGSFAPASVMKFNSWLNNNTTAGQRTAVGLPADLSGFDYRSYVADRGGKVADDIDGLWMSFHQQSTIEFFDWIKQEISDYAEFEVPFSANNVSVWDVASGGATSRPEYIETYRWFDYGLGELRSAHADPVFILESVRRAEELGKRQIFTLGDADVGLNRKVLAHTYAVGAHMVMPWDVFIPNNPRLFGDPADFQDITGFVRAHAELYDNYESAADVGPDLSDPRIDVWDPIRIEGGSGDLYALARAVPGVEQAPIVVHLVQWADNPSSVSIELRNEMFGWSSDRVMEAALLLPEVGELQLPASLDDGYSRYDLPPIALYGLLVVPPMPLPGDYNRDGLILADDYILWRNTLGSTSDLRADGNRNGRVDVADFEFWRSQFNNSDSGATQVSLPEPAGWLLLILAVWTSIGLPGCVDSGGERLQASVPGK